MQTFYPYLLAFHNLLRWVVVAAALAAIVVGASGWSGSKVENGLLRRFSIIFVASMDLQFLLGLILYIWASPVTQQAFQNMGAAMKVRELRFFAVEHTTLMLIALVLAHVGGALARKAKTVAAQYRGATICFALALIAILAGIPWFRPLLRFGR
jgi:hypothetical protein